MPILPSIVLFAVISAFWAFIYWRFRRAGLVVSINLLIIPAFFAIVGMTINRYYPPWTGTLVIGILHLILLFMFLVRSSQKKA